MSSTGLPESEPLPSAEPSSPETPRQRAASALFLIGAAGAIALALFAGFHAVSILYGVLYPPNPPVYDQLKQVSYVNVDHGVDTWRYTTTASPDDIAAFYHDQGAVCQHRGPASSYASGGTVGVTCEGQSHFSIFSMDYEVVITPEQTNNVVRISREVYWIGSPPITPTP